jgi:hypothetical protein
MADVLLLVFVGVVLVVCAFIIWVYLKIARFAWQRDRDLAKNGVDVEAEVIDREQTIGREGAPMCYITYRYRVTTPEGEQDLTNREQVFFLQYDRFQLGTKVWVTYLPSNPSVVLLSERVTGRV